MRVSSTESGALVSEKTRKSSKNCVSQAVFSRPGVLVELRAGGAPAGSTTGLSVLCRGFDKLKLFVHF